MKKFMYGIMALVLVIAMAEVGWGTDLVNENIQTWTNHSSYGSYTQTITAGDVSMVDCIVANAATTTGTCTAGRVQIKASSGTLTLPQLSSIGTIEFHIVAGGTGRSVKLQKYNGSTWDDITTFSGIGTTGATFTNNLNAASATIIRLSTASSVVYVHDIIITDYSAGTPAINVSPSVLSDFTYVEGSGPSSEQSFTVSGSNLTDNISIDAPTNYEISTGTSGSFSATDPIILTQSGGTVASTTIYVRLKAGLVINTYNGETITASSTSADNKTVTCSGTVTSHYRSKSTGNWGDAATWEKSADLSTWSDASTAPSSADETITIRNGHTVTITSSESIDQITVESGGQLTIASGQILTLNNGTGTDLTINGTVLNSGTLTISSSSWAVNSGGTYIHNSTAGISTPLGAATLDAASNFIYRGSISLSPSVSVSGKTYGNLTFDSESGSYSPSVSGSSALTINGNFTISENVSLTSSMTGAINIKGNFTNNGTYSTTSQTASFQGISAQSINGSSTTTFYGLTLNNSSGLTLNVSSIVSGTLTLTSGNITTDSYTLTLGSSASSTGTLTRTSGTVIGNFERWLATGTNSSLVFPVGTASNYRPVTISTASVETGGKILVAHTDGSDGADLSSTLNDGGYTINRRSNMYWTLTGTTISGGTYDISVNADGQSGISDAAKVRLIRSSDGSTFSLTGTHSDGSGTVFSRTGISVGTFDRFYLGSNVSDNSLPVSLTTFTAQPSGNAVTLAWTTESEIENLGFIVQRRQEAGEWKQVASYTTCDALAGHGSTTEAHEYSYTDAAVQPGATYTYLLSDVSYDGVEKKHTDKSVTVTIPEGGAAITGKYALSSPYPNPFNAQFTIPLTLKESLPVQIYLYDMNGKVAKVIENSVKPAGEYRLRTDTGDLSSGIYIVKMNIGGAMRTEKIVLMK
ncbi:MAG: T9SS type A sorting domain-containing protein [Candidatus Marinimicrobia bacterium]|nr:T9SS type A sorting domain-containing protein [Candidatus Neomarinimicrobiota bacterium]